jgi:hypothetical protein
MGDDELLEELAKLAREKRGPVDPRWDALTRGELSEDERAQLLLDEGDELLPAFEPLGDAFADEAAKRILASMDRPGSPPLSGESRPGSEARPADSTGATRAIGLAGPASGPRGEVVRPRFGRWAAVIIPLALAAMALLYVARPPAPVLPEYAIEVHGGDQVVRGDPATSGPVRLSSGSRVEIVARPAVRVTGAVTAEAVVHTSAGDGPWTGRIEVSDAGAVRAVGTLGQDLVLPAGPATVTITVHSGREAETLKVTVLVTDP